MGSPNIQTTQQWNISAGVQNYSLILALPAAHFQHVTQIKGFRFWDLGFGFSIKYRILLHTYFLMKESLKQRTAKGLFWSAINSGSTQVLNLVIGIILARLLTPEDYGIVGLLTIFIALAGDIQSAGFTLGLINIKHPEAKDYNSVFSFNVCASVILYTLLFLAAPIIADFFHQECLIKASRVTFLTFFISSLGIAHGGYMTKNMMNKEIAITGGIALVSSGTTGITLAFLDYGYWALIWQQITYCAVVIICRYHFVREWRPKLTLNFTPVWNMGMFSIKILVTKLINTLSNNILTVIFGRLFPIHQVGNYSQAYKWNTMANSLVSNTVGQIAQTIFVETNDNYQTGDNNDRQLRVFRKMMRFTCFFSMPLMFGLALVSREFILITIKEQWLGCVPLLQTLCISGAFMPIYTMYQNLTISHGRSGLYMWINTLQIILQIAVILAFYRFGMQTMVSAYSAFLILWLIPWHLFSGKLIGYRFTDALKDIMPFCIISAGIMAVVYFLTASLTNIWALISTRIALCVVLYYIAMKAAHVEILKEGEHFIKNNLLKRHKKNES